MNPSQCRALLDKPERGEASVKRFQHCLRWALAGVLRASSEAERGAWAECVFGGGEGRLRLSLSHENYVNLCLAAACARILQNRSMVHDFIASSDVHKQCVCKFVGQSQSINEAGDEWKWSALCNVISLVKLNFGAQQYVIQQASRQLTKIMYLCNVNNASSVNDHRIKIDQAVFCISKLYDVSTFERKINKYCFVNAIFALDG